MYNDYLIIIRKQLTGLSFALIFVFWCWPKRAIQSSLKPINANDKKKTRW